MMDDTDVVVVGAGISGLMCALELEKSGRSVLVLDKGRGPGGRMSTRRFAEGRFDHGAQFMTVRDCRFQKWVDEWLREGVIREWFCRDGGDPDRPSYPRYCGVSGMNDVPKYLARSLTVKQSQKVTKISRSDEFWEIQSETGECYHARHLVLSAPLPQSLELLLNSGLARAREITEELSKVDYEKGLATMLAVPGETKLPEAGFVRCDGPVLSWIADNRVKGISKDTRAITLGFAEKLAVGLLACF